MPSLLRIMLAYSRKRKEELIDKSSFLTNYSDKKKRMMTTKDEEVELTNDMRTLRQMKKEKKKNLY